MVPLLPTTTLSTPRVVRRQRSSRVGRLIIKVSCPFSSVPGPEPGRDHPRYERGTGREVQSRRSLSLSPGKEGCVWGRDILGPKGLEQIELPNPRVKRFRGANKGLRGSYGTYESWSFGPVCPDRQVKNGVRVPVNTTQTVRTERSVVGDDPQSSIGPMTERFTDSGDSGNETRVLYEDLPTGQSLYRLQKKGHTL